MTNKPDANPRSITTLLVAGCAVLVCLPAPLSAAPTDLATEPFITESAGDATVKPNLYFILDNSGSMNWDYLPDWVVDSSWCRGSAGTASLKCCRNAAGDSITSSDTNSTCLPQPGGSGNNLDGNGYNKLRGLPLFHAFDFNSAYYNPAIYYPPPKNANGTDKTSYSGTGSVPWDGYNAGNTITLTTQFPDVEWCTDTSYTDCLRADNYLVPGTINSKNYTTMREVLATGTKSFATGSPTSPTTANRAVGPYYYAMIPGEYCTNPKLTDCTVMTGPGSKDGKYYGYPANLRWCNNATGRVAGETGAVATDACQAIKFDGPGGTEDDFKYPRYPTLKLSDAVNATSPKGTISVSGLPDSGNTTGTNNTCNSIAANKKATVTSIKLNGTELLTSSFTYCDGNNNQSTRNNNLAEQIKSRIGNDFSATRSSATLTITAPAGAAYNNPALTVTISTASLSAYTQTVVGADAIAGKFVSGSFRRTDIVSGISFGNICVNSSGTVSEVLGACPSGQTTIVDRSSRSDCSNKPTCTYAEELRNFANWFAWYRNRMQLAKSSLSTAFNTIGDGFRVGYFTLNSSSSNLVNIAPFDDTQKANWYTKLFAAIPSGGTPLRQALANAGRLYAGKKATVISGATDPVEYSCQRNFTILSTDGYWNGSNGVDLNGAEITDADSSGMVIGGVTGPFSDGISKTLADVAAYYYKTDLRDASLSNCTGAISGVSVCAENVPTVSNPAVNDMNTKQHMTTFTIGLGIDGLMKYRDDYKTPTSEPTDDYDAVLNKTTANPGQGVCHWKSSGACGWPSPGNDKQENIDDLWHAAVNGHGTYYSARDSQALATGLKDVLKAIETKPGAGAAATTSNPNVVAGDNYVFSSQFKTVYWTGEFYRETMNETTGAVSFDAAKDWRAETLLDSSSWSSRNIFTFKTGGGTPRPFDFSATGLGGSDTICNPPANEKGCFAESHVSSNLSQWGALSVADRSAAVGLNLVNFLRGDQAYEDTLSESKLYRERKSRLGDIASSEAWYVGSYLYEYDNNYPGKGTKRSDPTVYVGANDGMLHAFNAGDKGSGGGTERWAYVPSMVIGNMHRLASKNYEHRFYVDGSPVAVDVHDGSSWKTILVGGLAGGGAGFYALDVSDQSNPKVLWEFRQKSGCTASTPAGALRYASSGISRMIEDCDLGYSFGNPVITKLPSGTWVVLLTSGYNNHIKADGYGGDGKGYLYVLNVFTGAILHKVTTGAGSSSSPSGFAKISPWSDNYMTDNTTKYVYGGDLEGNMWKFDLTSGTPAKSLLLNVGSTKPITAKARLGQIVTKNGTKKRVVFFPTGRLLGASDLEPVGQHSFYGIWDASGSSPSNLVSASASGGTDRSGSIYDTNSDGKSDNVFDNDSNLGWRLDFPAPGERGTTDPALVGSTLVFTTNQPQPGSSDACNKSAFQGWLWNIDYKSGHAVNVAGETGTSRSMAVALGGYATRPTVAVLQSGKPVSITTVTKNGGVEKRVDPVKVEDSSEGARRVTWRELTQ